jgi:hypothetical protein
MPRRKSGWLNRSTEYAVLAVLTGFSLSVYGQTVIPVQLGATHIKGLPDDWTHHHVLFSNPGSERDAIWQGRYVQWQKIVDDPRYVVDQLRRRVMAEGPAMNGTAWVNQALRNRPSVGDEQRVGRLGQGSHPVVGGPRLGERFLPKIHSDWSMNLGSGAALYAGQYPAKYSFYTTQSVCGGAATPDFVVYNTSVPGSNTSGSEEANIIAYDNLYSGCGGTVPSVYWSYYTGGGDTDTSPVISLDGSKIAFIEDQNPSGSATLQILKWKAGEGTDSSAPVAPDNLYTNGKQSDTGNTAWSSCPSTGSCLISVAFQTVIQDDVTSAPYYDYSTDTLWVGDAGGNLHEFTGVFNGTPAEVTTGGWPASVGCVGPLTGPVYDSTNSTVFVGDACGSLAAVTSSGGVTVSGRVGYGPGDISDAPLLDPVTGSLYLAVAADGSCTSTCYTIVVRFPVNFSTGATGNGVHIGSGGGATMYAGTFDNAYFTSTDPSSPNGNLWVCGNAGGDPTLYAIPINGSTMGTPIVGPDVSGTATTCSPVTEFCTNSGADCTATAGTDYIFVSPQSELAPSPISGCGTDGGGCVISYSVSGTSATLSGAGEFGGGASGMIVDTQDTTTSGTFQLYFGTLSWTSTCDGNSAGQGNGSGGCAIQAPLAAP